jgi:hypothetical protein
VCWCAANGPAPDLQHLHVFDAEVARFYMTQKCGRASWLMESRPDWLRSIGGVRGQRAAA